MATHTNYISLYTGAAGLDLGFGLAVPRARAVCYVERDAEAAAFLVRQMEAGRIDPAPLWSDSGTFDGGPWRGVVDFVIGGFPCQPWSVAGLQQGTDDDRWLWPHIERIVRDVRPGGVFLENVTGVLRGGIQHVLGGLATLGFDAEWCSLRASDVGAPHRRERVFILAYRNGRPIAARKAIRTGGVAAGCGGRDVADSTNQRHERGGRARRRRAGSADQGTELGDTGHEPQQLQQRTQGVHQSPGAGAFPPGPEGDWSHIDPRYWPAVEPEVRGMVDGLADGLARLTQLRLAGNGVVPQQAAAAFARLQARFEKR